jgi:hypothetical protein
MRHKITLLAGETPLQNAPVLTLNRNNACIPQHYLQFEHTLESVENILMDIEYWDSYPVFAVADLTGIYIQVGIIGFDNYRPLEKQSGAKIVYGRKWRVEAQLPSSEIMQTVFLALQKAREHEIRELFRLQHKGQICTPFNNHHDLPLMTDLARQLTKVDEPQINEGDNNCIAKWLENINYDHAGFAFKRMQRRSNGQYLLDLTIIPTSKTHLPELADGEITLQLEQLSANELLYELMDKLVH